MDCKDLMIGDWVRFKENYPQKELQGKIAKVKGVRGRIDVRTQDGEYYESEHPDWLEPIPLTEEILVKNGFEYAYNEVSKMQNKQLLIANIDGHYIEIRLDKKNIAIWYDYYENESDFYCDVFLPLPYYVQGFQHLLRLCGIEKELTI